MINLMHFIVAVGSGLQTGVSMAIGLGISIVVLMA